MFQLKIVKVENIDCYENISRQQPENIFALSAASIPTPIFQSIAIPRLKHRHRAGNLGTTSNEHTLSSNFAVRL